MAVRYYDDILAAKLKKWVPDNSRLRVLKPDETKRLFETKADDTDDAQIKLPFIALARNNDIELLSTIKNSKSFDGLKLTNCTRDTDGNIIITDNTKTAMLNVIPIKVTYQLDIYTKTFEEGDEYVRNFVFKLINNPLIKIEIPYNGLNICHTANIRLLSTISDTSAISERLFSGQFTRWTLQLEIQDAMLFSVPYRKNWRLYIDDDSVLDLDLTDAEKYDLSAVLEVSEKITLDGEIEQILK